MRMDRYLRNNKIRILNVRSSLRKTRKSFQSDHLEFERASGKLRFEFHSEFPLETVKAKTENHALSSARFDEVHKHLGDKNIRILVSIETSFI